MFDTQIVSNVCSREICPSRWDAVQRNISARGRYVISALTLYEVLAAIANGDDAHFEENRRRLTVLYQPPNREFLPLVRDFIRRVVFGLTPLNLKFQPKKLRTWVDVVLSAKSREDLSRGRILVPRLSRARTFGFHLDLLTKQINDGKQAHSKRLEGLRQGRLHASSGETWTRALLTRIDAPVNSASIATLLARLEAASRYERSLYELAKNNTYDFAAHDSDWIDSQQLYYLCDPLVYLVTNDKGMKFRTGGSPQNDRILSFEDLERFVF